MQLIEESLDRRRDRCELDCGFSRPILRRDQIVFPASVVGVLEFAGGWTRLEGSRISRVRERHTSPGLSLNRISFTSAAGMGKPDKLGSEGLNNGDDSLFGSAKYCGLERIGTKNDILAMCEQFNVSDAADRQRAQGRSLTASPQRQSGCIRSRVFQLQVSRRQS